MKKWRVYYYRYYSTVAWKDVTANTAEQALKRAKVKTVISLIEL